MYTLPDTLSGITKFKEVIRCSFKPLHCLSASCVEATSLTLSVHLVLGWLLLLLTCFWGGCLAAMPALTPAERTALQRAVSVHGWAWDVIAASGACPYSLENVHQNLCTSHNTHFDSTIL